MWGKGEGGKGEKGKLRRATGVVIAVKGDGEKERQRRMQREMQLYTSIFFKLMMDSGNPLLVYSRYE